MIAVAPPSPLRRPTQSANGNSSTGPASISAASLWVRMSTCMWRSALAISTTEAELTADRDRRVASFWTDADGLCMSFPMLVTAIPVQGWTTSSSCCQRDDLTTLDVHPASALEFPWRAEAATARPRRPLSPSSWTRSSGQCGCWRGTTSPTGGPPPISWSRWGGR